MTRLELPNCNHLVFATGLSCLVLMALAFFARASHAFTLEEVLSAPYPGQLAGSVDSGRIAWSVNDEGRRNVWTAAAPEFVPARLTDDSRDDGQAIADIAVSPNGEWVVYVRGGHANRAGEYPNPVSEPVPPEQAVWAVPADGESEPVRLGEGHSPNIGPQSKAVAYVLKGQIYLTHLSKGPEQDASDPTPENQEPRPLFTARGNNSSPRFSPSGDRLAFVSDRGDHGFIGVYVRNEKQIKWLAPGVDRDSRPVWSPDGNRIAFLRYPGRKRDETVNIMANQPYAIWIADVRTGEASKRWQSPGEDGGFAHFYPDEPLRWTAGGQLLFYSEHDGWLHVYAMDADDGALVDLTPGECITENSSLSADGRVLYFSSNCGDIDRRHIWRTGITEARPKLLTDTSGIATHPVALGDDWLAWRAADAIRPTAVTVAPASNVGKARRISPAALPEAFPAEQLIEPEAVVFEAADGIQVHGQLFLPRQRAGTREDGYPAVIFMHGGPIRQMLPGWHYHGYYARAYAMNQYLASQGYVVLAVNYRAGIGYGRDFRLAENQGPRGASEYQDIVAAGLYLRDRKDVDPERIGLWGGSYGGLLTAMGLARNSDLFAAGVDLHGVHDWSFHATDFLPGGAWGIEGEEALEKAPPVFPHRPSRDLGFTGAVHPRRR